MVMNFVTRCCYLQNEFLKSRRGRMAASPVLPGLSPAESWWWEKVYLARLQCEWSLVMMAPALEQMP